MRLALFVFVVLALTLALSMTSTDHTPPAKQVTHTLKDR